MIGQMRLELPLLRPLVIAILCVATAACAWQDEVPPQAPAGGGAAPVPASRAPEAGRTHTRAQRAVAVALDQIGTPYRYGGATPRGFDCSGLVNFAYARVGLALPRTTEALWRELRRVDASSLRVGDLLFYRIDGKLAHVALYAGEGRLVHAPSSGSRVRMEQVDAPYYAARLAGVARPLP